MIPIEERFLRPSVMGVVNVTPIFDDAGRCTHLVGSVHDISERKRADDALKESEARFRDVADTAPGITRRGAGTGFSYRGPGGERIRDRDEIERIRALAIPPAWTDVWICRDPDGHLIEVGQTTDPEGDWSPAHWPSSTPAEESE